MDIFEGTPREKFFDIIFNANRNLVENEIENLLIKIIALSELCEENGISQAQVQNYILQNPDRIEDGLNDAFIHHVGNILSNNE
ncbi:Domain of uncharacterised function (DUF2018) [Campylobacter geochelonis]|uniref:Domain of uncharacterized function (DUF2018) n=1 Tax=Campylobacter geochelonis TaxID=1780362 RepID=A0A128EI82_9BACT|nr:DUF2018 domain-containing protein [Campylobacter geochelonis]CZE47863.1 Domain of uncharacterised function (DUF2018) [Campylobacter geochelonis]CZE48317.1 Domain of uncharacterised function (DUF2018) [Campylobacter geochelonis]CZE50840.1 Domain of uncharacterised function (DUF2018) [Campylobacter geochelonis]